jgi:hypothetical protein
MPPTCNFIPGTFGFSCIPEDAINRVPIFGRFLKAESLPRTSSQRASNAQSVQSTSGQGHSIIKYVPLSRSQGQPYVPKQIQIQGIMPLKMDCKYTQQQKGTHNTQTQNVNSQNQKVHSPIPPNVVPQIEHKALPFATSKNSIRIGSFDS